MNRHAYGWNLFRRLANSLNNSYSLKSETEYTQFSNFKRLENFYKGDG